MAQETSPSTPVMIICADGSSSLMDVPIRAHTVSEHYLSFFLNFLLSGLLWLGYWLKNRRIRIRFPTVVRYFFTTYPVPRQAAIRQAPGLLRSKAGEVWSCPLTSL